MTVSSLEQKKLLEALMGRGSLEKLPRNFKSNYELQLEASKNSQRDSSYSINTNQDTKPEENPSVLNDHRICKSYVVGSCPYDLFQGTKQDFGRCSKIHLAKHKLQYEQFVSRGFKFDDFELEYYRDLEAFIQDCNAKIEIAIKRLEHTPEEKEKLSSRTKELDSIDLKIALTQQELDLLIQNNEVVKSVELSQNLEQMLKQRSSTLQAIRDLSESLGQSSQQKLQVCEVCAAYLSRLDSDRRLADHFVGKIHLGYVFMRKEIQRLRKKHNITRRKY